MKTPRTRRTPGAASRFASAGPVLLRKPRRRHVSRGHLRSAHMDNEWRCNPKLRPAVYPRRAPSPSRPSPRPQSLSNAQLCVRDENQKWFCDLVIYEGCVHADASLLRSQLDKSDLVRVRTSAISARTIQNVLMRPWYSGGLL